MKFTTEHIEIIRKYFLSNVKENTPASIASLLPQLKQVFNAADDDTGLSSLLKSMDAGEQLETFQLLQQDYYASLAILHNSGSSNADIDILIKNDHAAFKQELNFQKELQAAFLLNERADIKRRFGEFDNGSAVSTEDINLAFTLAERERLKDQFRAIENKAALKPVAPVIKFNWKQLAIAATIIGALLTTTFYVFDKDNNEKHGGIASVVPVKKIKPEDSTANRNIILKQLNEELAAISPSAEKHFTVLQEPSPGFAAKDEGLLVRQYDLQAVVSKINNEIINIQGIAGLEKTTRLLTVKADSLKNLENKYHFYNGVLTIYTLSKKGVKIFKIDAGYYMQVDSILYECKRSSGPVALKKLTDNATRERINKILFVTQN